MRRTVSLLGIAFLLAVAGSACDSDGGDDSNNGGNGGGGSDTASGADVAGGGGDTGGGGGSFDPSQVECPPGTSLDPDAFRSVGDCSSLVDRSIACHCQDADDPATCEAEQQQLFGQFACMPPGVPQAALAQACAQGHENLDEDGCP